MTIKANPGTITEAEAQQVLKNEERLWDMAAITAAPTLVQLFVQYPKFGTLSQAMIDRASEEAYNLADALVLERRKRFNQPQPVPGQILGLEDEE